MNEVCGKWLPSRTCQQPPDHEDSCERLSVVAGGNNFLDGVELAINELEVRRAMCERIADTPGSWCGYLSRADWRREANNIEQHIAAIRAAVQRAET